MDGANDLLKQFCGLSDEQLSSLDSCIQEKLVIGLESLKHDAHIAQSTLDEKEASLGDTAKKHMLEIENLKNECQSLKDKTAYYEKCYNDSDKKYRDALTDKGVMQEKVNDTLTVNNELQFSIKNLQSDYEVLSEQLKNKIENLELLSTELNSFKAESESVRKLKVDTLCKIEEVRSQESSLKAQKLRWETESSSIRRHNEWLEERLKETTDKLLTIRKDMVQKCHTLESELSLKNVELENATKSNERLESSVEKLQKANEDYIIKLKQVADEQIRLEHLFGSELDAQKQLVSLYRDKASEAENKNTELVNATASMQTLLKEAYENVSRLESDASTMRQLFSEEQAKWKENLDRVTSELTHSRELLDKFRVDGLSEEELRQLNPAVTATLAALKRGHSLTQLYSDYLQVVEDRDQLKLDKYRLTEYVKQLVDDVKERAPLLREQKEKYEHLQTQVKDLSLQLRASNNKLDDTQCKLQEMQRRAGYFQRESSRLKITCTDLSKQVQHLLREVEVVRGTFIDDAPMDGDESQPINGNLQLPDSSSLTTGDLSQLVDNIASSASTVIDDHLVTWSSLRELQSQNQRLLSVARDLASQLEKYERSESETETRVEELSQRAESLFGELEVLRLTVKEAKNEAQMARRQRDAYRAILERYDIEVNVSQQLENDETTIAGELEGSNKADGRLSLSTVTGAIPSATVERLEESLKSLEAEFKRYRDDKVESDKIYATTVDAVRKEASEARILNQKLAAQLDFTHEKLRTMEANVGGYKQEITILREMNARYSTSAASSEAEISRLHQELAHTSDKLLTVEVDARHATRQLEVARANETRWRQEIESLRKQDQMHSRLMYQLEAIQGNLEQRDSLDRSSSERRLQQLETQLSEAQAAFVEASQSNKSTRATLGHELAIMTEKVAASEMEVESLRQQLETTESILKKLQPKASDEDENGSSSSEKTTTSHETKLIEEMSDQLRQTQHEVENLQARLASAKQQADQMKELAEAAESRVLEAVEENKRMEERLNTTINEFQQRCEFLDAQLDLEKKERQNLVNENIRIAEEAHQMNAELRRELTSVQSDLVETKARCESALELEAGAKAEIEAHGRVAQEAREKYERELALHAEDVEALTTARSNLEAVTVKLHDAQDALGTAQTEAANAKTQLDRETAGWETTKEELDDRLLQADKAQTSLQEQIIKLTQQLVSLRKVMETTNRSEVASTSADEPYTDDDNDLKTSEDLLQLVNYIRRQKNIAETACDAQSAEVGRLLLRVSSLEADVSHLTEQLEDERKSNELAVESASRHSELMESVQQLNLVTESNRLLRHERETLRSKSDQLEQQLDSLESSVQPLRQENEQIKGTMSMLKLEMQSLEEERNRWKERCNRLVETAQRLDPEQYRFVCNERDELQRRLRKLEEESLQLTTKISELEQVIQRQCEELRSTQKALEDSKQNSSELNVRYDSVCQELENKETTIAKLRDIGRKYRQEAETLRRQVLVNQSDEAQLLSVNEALTEAKADVVTLRDELATLRSDFSRLEYTVNESLQLVEELRVEDIVESTPENHPLISAIRSLAASYNNLRCKADSQHERLLRMQLIESQLTKSLRDSAELRQRLQELQSTTSTDSPTSVSAQPPLLSSLSTAAAIPTSLSSSQPSNSSTALMTSGTANHAVLNYMEATTTAEAVDLSTSQRLLESDYNSSSAMAAVVTPLQQQSLIPDQCSALTATTAVVPAWILRASTSSAVQPVPPTPAVTPPITCCNSNNMTVAMVGGQASVKQMAEIKPITSNVATVMPTLVLSQPTVVAFTTSVVSPGASGSILSAPSTNSPVLPATSGSLTEPNYLTATTLRSAQPLRHVSTESLPSTSMGLFSSSSSAGKRRLEETVAPVAAVESSLTTSSQLAISSFSSIPPNFPGSDPKRLRQQQQSQVGPSGILTSLGNGISTRTTMVSPHSATNSVLLPTIPTSQFSDSLRHTLQEMQPDSPSISTVSTSIGIVQPPVSTVASGANSQQTLSAPGASFACGQVAQTGSTQLVVPTTSVIYSADADKVTPFLPTTAVNTDLISTSYASVGLYQDTPIAPTPELSQEAPQSRGDIAAPEQSAYTLSDESVTDRASPEPTDNPYTECMEERSSVEEEQGVPEDDDAGSLGSELDDQAAKEYIEGEDDEEEAEEQDEEAGDVSFTDEEEAEAGDVIELSSESDGSEVNADPDSQYAALDAEEASESDNEQPVYITNDFQNMITEERDEGGNFIDTGETVDDDQVQDDVDANKIEEGYSFDEGEEDEDDAVVDADVVTDYLEPLTSHEGPNLLVTSDPDRVSEAQLAHRTKEQMRDDCTDTPSHVMPSSTCSVGLFSFTPATKSSPPDGLFSCISKAAPIATGLFSSHAPVPSSSAATGEGNGAGLFQSSAFLTATTTVSVSTESISCTQQSALLSSTPFRGSILKPISSIPPMAAGGAGQVQDEVLRQAPGLFSNPVRPKIQPIVWDDTTRSNTEASGSGCLQSNQPCSKPRISSSLTSAAGALARRKKWGPRGGLNPGRPSAIPRQAHPSALPAPRHDSFGGGESGGSSGGPPSSMRPHGPHSRRL